MISMIRMPDSTIGVKSFASAHFYAANAMSIITHCTTSATRTLDTYDTFDTYDGVLDLV